MVTTDRRMAGAAGSASPGGVAEVHDGAGRASGLHGGRSAAAAGRLVGEYDVQPPLSASIAQSAGALLGSAPIGDGLNASCDNSKKRSLRAGRIW